ncbi:MAG TPA: hypothetical protein VFV93_12165 [Thermomicrobiales bacterium]|nr:hypothetical protein [Thermomicrobiales bacterium]
MLAISMLAAVALGMLASGPAHAQEPEPGRAPTLATFRGSYNGWSTPKVEGPVRLHAGLVVVRARHGGNANFGLTLVTADPGKAPEDSYENRYLMINAIGRYDGAAAELLTEDGDYYLLIGAGGAYEFTIEQPMPSNVTPVDKRAFDGAGQQVTSVFALDAGTYSINGTSNGDGNFRVWMYEVDDLGGGAVEGNVFGRMFDVTSGPANESATVTLRRKGLYLFYVEAWKIAGPQGAADWTVRVD